MRSIRLLPIVVFASLALLAFKTIGLVTTGSYVLTGTSEAAAAGSAEPTAETGIAPEEPITIPPEPTLEDQAPTLSDGAPTLSLKPEAAAAEHGEAAEHAETPEPVGEAAAPATEAPAQTSHDAIEQALDLNAEAAPATGQPVMSESERTLLRRLAERREELDSVQSELATRQQLVEAAEKRLAERTAALAAIEARIGAMVDQAAATDEAQFKSLVSMYENMKPADAAKIFNALEMDVLLRVAKVINPRKMAPIMAKMDPNVAQILTVRLAEANPVTQPTDVASVGGDLPQIVGN